MSTQIWPTREDYDLAAQRAVELLAARGIASRMVGSYASGKLRVPYSDLDVLSVADSGAGATVRDAVIAAARQMDDAICVTVDPFDRQAIVYSIHRTGLQIDWFIVELAGGIERPVWRGAGPAPTNVTCRGWSSLLYTLSLLSSDAPRKRELAAHDLAEHWVWLAEQGVDVSTLPPHVPSPDDDLPGLIRATASVIPAHPELSAILLGRLDEIGAGPRT